MIYYPQRNYIAGVGSWSTDYKVQGCQALSLGFWIYIRISGLGCRVDNVR